MPDFASRDICSWHEFNETIYAMNPTGPSQVRPWLFRGQTRDYVLKTTVERALDSWGIDLEYATAIEFQTIREFRRRLQEPAHHRVHADMLYCIALMQHHGAPTRLLDCTYSPFVAAAFALEEGTVGTQPIVWCFNAKWCEDEAKKVTPDDLVERRNDDAQRNDETFIPLYQIESIGATTSTRRKFVKSENPFHLNERLTTQQGVFLCPADLGSSFVKNIEAMNGWDSQDNILKLRLRLDEHEAVRFARNLKNMNISMAALFPGLDGFARSIRQQIAHYHDLAKGKAGVSGR